MGTSFKQHPFRFTALRSAPIVDIAVFTTRLEIKWKDEAEKIRNEIASVNISEVFEFLGLCASMFLIIT